MILRRMGALTTPIYAPGVSGSAAAALQQVLQGTATPQTIAAVTQPVATKAPPPPTPPPPAPAPVSWMDRVLAPVLAPQPLAPIGGATSWTGTATGVVSAPILPPVDAASPPAATDAAGGGWYETPVPGATLKGGLFGMSWVALALWGGVAVAGFLVVRRL